MRLTFHPLLVTALTASLLIACAAPAPQEKKEAMDVDLADTLNFEELHRDKDSAVKIWSKEKGFGIDTGGKPAKVYENSEAATASSAPAEDKKGKRYEIRELYSITGSERTGYTPSTVVQALYLQMQGLCPAGWRKLDERSEPDGDAFYMYYTLECL